MSDYYLKTDDEAAMWASLESAGLVNQDHFPVGISLDVIGTIYKPTGQVQMVDGMEVPVMAPIPGYHANIRGELTETQIATLSLIDPPDTPFRVWA